MSFKRAQSAFCHGQCAIRIAAFQPGRRTFSNTTALHKFGPVPVFTEVSSPELQSLLEKFRKKCIMPAHLAANQQALIYKESKRKKLEAEPVIVNLSGEEFVLEHIDRAVDVPSKHRTLRTAAKLMEGKDWNNLPNLLKGLKNADFNSNSKNGIAALRFMISRAGEAGRMDVILESVRRAATTGLVLRNTEIVRHILFQLHMKALGQDQSLEDLNKTLSWAEQIAALMEDELHAGGLKSKSLDDPRSSPLVIGLLLNLAALRSSRYLELKDDDGKVLEYATKFLGLRKPLKILSFEERQLLYPGINGINTFTNEESHLSASIRENLPVLQGIKLALAILDPKSPVSKNLKQQIEIVEPQLLAQKEAFSQIVQEKGVFEKGIKNKTLLYYDTIMGSES